VRTTREDPPRSRAGASLVVKIVRTGKLRLRSIIESLNRVTTGHQRPQRIKLIRNFGKVSVVRVDWLEFWHLLMEFRTRRGGQPAIGDLTSCLYERNLLFSIRKSIELIPFSVID
jgi:hypothetical protein